MKSGVLWVQENPLEAAFLEVRSRIFGESMFSNLSVLDARTWEKELDGIPGHSELKSPVGFH